MKRKKKKAAKGIVTALLCLVLFGLIYMASHMDRSLAQEGPGAETYDYMKPLDNTVEYEGATYQYNSSMETYLFLGIDKEGVVEPVKDGIDGGQSDAIFLIAINHDTEQISVIAINRNTLTEVDVYDSNGIFQQTKPLQLCLQHGYGDGAALSCERSVAAVENLFYDVSIDGYISMNMGGIPLINDAVGGATLEILESVSDESKDVFLTEGDTVTLRGPEAYTYVRYRDTDVFDSASMRLERQIQYVLALFDATKAYVGEDLGLAVEVFESAAAYICTDVNYDKISQMVMEYSFDESSMYSLIGTTRKNAGYEEFHVNEQALFELVLEVFYERISA